ncbi:short chain dehydrogenase [Corynespora cassiicola Philippines]|uniref:Short chain dehydrogenase n=1 Tax=Corynespora cassiicola Philippines TaxID=1448308 RepID=A0A2T2NHX3_CORCC|nr:short chain dehydrogenase [Corynespora cassiicola Philippines]
MQPPFPSPVPTWHNALYPAVDPSNRSQSHKGQTVVITGAGSGIGRMTARAFAVAGASHIVLIGRVLSKLEETKSQISIDCQISIFAADVADEAAMKRIADAVGMWDVLIMNAGYLPDPSPAAKARLDDYWASYEINVKSLIIGAKVFFPTANPARAAALATVAGALVLPTKAVLGLSGYLVAKLAAVKTMEFLAAENSNIFCAAVHPGMVDTDIFRKSGATPDMMPMDDVGLPAGFMVWLTLPEAHFLNGRLVWANWDVEELKNQAQEISSGSTMTAGIEGWPFSHT